MPEALGCGGVRKVERVWQVFGLYLLLCRIPAEIRKFPHVGRIVHLPNLVNLLRCQIHSQELIGEAPDRPGLARFYADRGKRIAVLRTAGGVRSALFSPDGHRIVTTTSDSDGLTQVWHVENGKEIAVLGAHARAVKSVSFSPDGRRIVTTSNDIARMWDADSGAEITVFRGHEGALGADQIRDPATSQPGSAEQDRLSAHAPSRTTSAPCAPVPCQFQLSGPNLDQAAEGYRQGRGTSPGLSGRDPGP